MARLAFGRQIKKEPLRTKRILTKQRQRFHSLPEVTGHSGDKYNDYADKLQARHVGVDVIRLQIQYCKHRF